MSQLETVSKDNVEIFQTGSWNGDHYSIDDLQAMVNAFNKLGFHPPIKAGHEGGQEKDEFTRMRLFGEPALGYVKALRVVGNKLVADLRNIPKRFANLVNAGAFNRISSEIYWNYKDDASGKTYPRVLKAIAFLGARIPALTSLKAIEALYAENPSTKICHYQLPLKERFMDAQSEIIELAKTYERSGASVLESYKRVLRERPDLAMAYEGQGRRKTSATSPGDELDFATQKYMVTSGERDYLKAANAVRRHNPLLARRYDFTERPNAIDPKQQLGALLSDSIAAGDIDGALSIAAAHRPLCIATASAWFEQKATEIDRHAPAQSGGMLQAIELLQREHPGLTRMWNNGAVSEEALYSLYPQWFKD